MKMDEIEALYREEAAERLDSIEQGLLSLEAGVPLGDLIDGLFRDAHSLKGGAGMLGLDETYRLAHALEEVLGVMRNTGGAPAAVIEPLLHATDTLRKAVAGELEAVEQAIGQLHHARENVSNGDSGQEAETVAVAEPPTEAGDGAERRTLRVDAAKVDRVLGAVGETILHHRQLENRVSASAPAEREFLDRGDLLLDELQHAVVQLRLVPLASVAAPFPRGVRDIAAAHGKKVSFSFDGGDTHLDRAMLDGTADAISHLLRNAVAHGIESPAEREQAGKPETGSVWLKAEPHGDRALIEVGDDGRGVAPQLVELAEAEGSALADILAQPGFSTAEEVSDLSGRGVGLDAVRAHAEAVGGTLEIASTPGSGTTVSLLLPVSVAVLRVMLVERASRVFGVPIGSIAEVRVLDRDLSLAGRRWAAVDGQAVTVVDLVAALGGSGPDLPERPAAVVLGSRQRVAVLCDRMLGEEELIVKPLGALLADTRGYLGAALLEDGRIALIADPGTLIAAADRAPRPATAATAGAAPSERGAPRVLVVDDQFTVRELQRSILEAAGYQAETARDGREAWDRLRGEPDVDAVVTDVEMPEMDGFELLGAIRGEPSLSALPVVVVSSRGREEDQQRGLEAGADAYIVKESFDQQALLDAIARLVGRGAAG